MQSPFLSYKYSNYFDIYKILLSPFKNKKITFVEVGILHGGSLFMWKKFLGKKARIIGIDFNPNANHWKKHGFEIFILNQANPAEWNACFKKIGKIDILLDDGGHTNIQQITTLISALPFIKNNGKIIIEDTHASYLSEFGNPSKFSFISYAKKIIDIIHERSGLLINKKTNVIRSSIYSVQFFDSIVCFNINRTLCIKSKLLKNGGEISKATDFRHYGFLRHFIENKFISDSLKKSVFIKTLLKYFFYKFQNIKLIKNFWDVN